MFDPITVLTAGIPLVTDLGKAVIQRWIAPDKVKPVSIDDYIKMRQADIDLFKTLNEAGGTNPTYQWVEAIVRLQRPFVVLCILGAWTYAHVFNLADTAAVDNAAAAVGFYLFADRTLFYTRKALGTGNG
jgi:hypothetical protein